MSRIAARMRAALFTLTCAILAAAVAPPSFADDTLRVGVYSFPVAEGNPFRSTSISETYVYAAVYDSLTQISGDGEVLPMLALDWTAENPTTWVFELRPDVVFSDGTPFDAEAVIRVVEYLTSPAATGSSWAQELSMLSIARARDPLTVEILTETPALNLPALMAGIRITAPAYTEALIDEVAGAQPIGSGPFAITNWSSGLITMTAHLKSWRAPQVAAMEFRLIPERSVRVQTIITGDTHIAFGLGAEDIPILEAAGQTYWSGPGGSAFGLMFVNVNESPVQNEKVRQALNYAVDKQAYIDVLLRGLTRPAAQATPSIAYGYDPELKAYPHDPDKARALLAEAGYPDGFRFDVEAVVEGTTGGSEILQFVESQLAEVGVDMVIKPMPLTDLIRKAVSGGFEGDAFAMDFDTTPTLDALRPLPMHSCLRPVPWYCDPVVVPWIETAKTTFDPEERLANIRKVLKRYHESPPMLFLHETVMFDGLNEAVSGYDPVARLPNYHEVRLTE